MEKGVGLGPGMCGLILFTISAWSWGFDKKDVPVYCLESLNNP